MKETISIYLGGSIQKGHGRTDETYWTQEDQKSIRDVLSDYNIAFLNPAFRTDDLSDQRSVFGRDMLQVFCADFLFVDARDKRGIGVGAEMMWAKFHRIPVVAWAPIDTHYHKKSATVLGVPVLNFVHPFVEGLCDKVVETPAEGAKWMQLFLKDPSIEIKDVDAIRSMMQHYKAKQLENDGPMRELLAASEKLQKRAYAHERL